jgi:hypothetical protein
MEQERRRMGSLTIVGQCRGDLAMFKRQLERAKIARFADGSSKPKFWEETRRDEKIIVLGDLISPLNAWCAFAPTSASEDSEILKIAVLVAEHTGACIVEGLHELMLFSGDTSRCHLGSGHRALLALVRSPKFGARWASVSCSAAYGLTRAGRSIKAIVQDNASIPPPCERLAPYWPNVSAFDRCTRYTHRELEHVPTLAWCSRSYAIHPSALCAHLSSVYSRSRCGPREWGAAVDEIAEQYRAFDDARRATLVVVRGEPVRDDESGCIDGERSDVQEMIRACLEPTIERYKVDASAAALAAIATQRLFHKGAKRSQ